MILLAYRETCLGFREAVVHVMVSSVEFNLWDEHKFNNNMVDAAMCRRYTNAVIRVEERWLGEPKYT